MPVAEVRGGICGLLARPDHGQEVRRAPLAGAASNVSDPLDNRLMTPVTGRVQYFLAGLLHLELADGAKAAAGILWSCGPAELL
jgi:hypothetical protein